MRNVIRNGHEQRLAALRESIRHSFPAEPYLGKVTPSDGEWTPELDDDQALYEALHGRRWTEIPPDILRNQPDGFVLLTDDAFVAFLPAWLLRSLEDVYGKNEVRSFVIYVFSPNQDAVPDMTWFIKNKLQSLNPEQRSILRSLLTEFSESEASSYLRAEAAKAVALIDSVK